MILFSLYITSIYCLLILGILIGSYRVSELKKEEYNHNTFFSIVVPLRNEEKALPQLIKSISELSYDPTRFELLFVDDQSTDGSLALLTDFKLSSTLDIQILSRTKSGGAPKKEALTLAINKAKFDWIITTDADCVLPCLLYTSPSPRDA